MSEAVETGNLPLILAGPILRRVTSDEVVIWLATSRPGDFNAKLLLAEGTLSVRVEPVQVSAADTLHFCLMRVHCESPLPEGVLIRYDIALESQWLLGSAPELHYSGHDLPGFVFQPKLRRILHGSCRKPHLMPDEAAEDGDSGDGLARADDYLATLDDVSQRPSAILMSGDQIYADDVAGPMLVAIHQLIRHLGLSEESLPGTDLTDSRVLHDESPHYYDRDNLLPQTELAGKLRDQFFSGAKKPVFTSVNARNHLMSLAELSAMYLLVWSPVCWDGITLDMPDSVPQDQHERYAKERRVIENFRGNLTAARRVMANIPIAMIFDDHDVTDDWNLTAAWGEAAYEHPLSRRVIGNALISYLLFQAWGNAPEKFPSKLIERAGRVLRDPASDDHSDLINTLLEFDEWHFEWPTSPLLIVLDTRTHRWRSERSLNRPSGLMDWEAMTDLQQKLIGHEAVVLVSAAPVFGVKLIEAIQRVFTWLGKPLMVDAENWMAHRGAAHVLMNLFRHPKTPQNFVILSGDVHYSFVYDIHIRGRRSSPDIWQITSSGIRNEFPPKLLDVFDRLNRWLFAPWSPLNWLTKRRDMRVAPRRPESASRGERLLNAAGIGLVELDEHGAPSKVQQLCAAREDVTFQLSDEQARWE